MAPPNRKKGSNKFKGTSSKKFEIDVEKIPSSRQRTVFFSEDYANYYLFSAICCIRGFSTTGDFMFGPKPVVFENETKSYQNLFLLTLNDGDFETAIIIGLHDIYLYGVCCNGEWLYFDNIYYTIKGGSEALFGESYPEGKDFKVVLRNCINVLHNDDPENWATAYYDLAVNIAESVRFDGIMREVLKSTTKTLIGKLKWLVNNWSVLSKYWIIWCNRAVWNPRRNPCQDIDEKDGDLMLAIVKYQDVGENEMKPKEDDPNVGAVVQV